MSISLRCPGCGKVYEVREDLAGKQAKCKCGAAMKVPRPGPATDDAAWEDEVIRALGPSAPAGPAQQRPGTPAPSPAGPAAEPTAEARTSRGPEGPLPTGPRQAAGAAGAPASRRSSLVRLAKTDVRRLLRRDPWRAIIGLAGLAYGTLATLAFGYAIATEPAVGLILGQTTSHVAQAGLAVGMALGGVLILKHDKSGPACAGLAAVMYCLFPFWGLLPGLNAALHSGEFLPFLWLAVQYAVPVALMVWCLRDQTRREAEGERLQRRGRSGKRGRG
jgi:hypothetical protein